MLVRYSILYSIMFRYVPFFPSSFIDKAFRVEGKK